MNALELFTSNMITPPFLKPGDTIGIMAPGRKISPENIEVAISIFQSWGLNVKLANHLFSNSHSYMAGTDNQRLADLQHLINDSGVRAIVCARGGYGSSRFIDEVDFSPLLQNPKWVIGFSDVTSIHLKLFKLGIESIHATMPILFSKSDSIDSIESLRKNLFGEYESIQAQGSPFNRLGEGRGKLIGGNLSLLVDALGTPSEPDTTGKILVIEEIEEYLYKIDRMINHLKRSRKLESLAGLVIGHFTSVLDTELSFGETVEKIISYHIRDFSFPVAFQFPTGHENPNLAWRHGAEAMLRVDNDKSQLSMISTASIS